VRTRLKTLAKDHLQQAYYILQGDEGFAHVQRLIARTLDVMDSEAERDAAADEPTGRVVRFRPFEPPRGVPSAALLRRRTGTTDT
jgi:hypothetical protein